MLVFYGGRYLSYDELYVTRLFRYLERKWRNVTQKLYEKWSLFGGAKYVFIALLIIIWKIAYLRYNHFVLLLTIRWRRRGVSILSDQLPMHTQYVSEEDYKHWRRRLDQQRYRSERRDFFSYFPRNPRDRLRGNFTSSESHYDYFSEGNYFNS